MVHLFNVIPFRAEGHEIQFLKTKSFSKDADRVFSVDELSGFLNYVAARPDAGVVIPGTSGLRKIRWAAKGQGKRGGARVIYYFRDLNMPLMLLAVYAKGEAVDLPRAVYNQIEAKVQVIVANLLAEADRQGNESA